MSRQWLTSTSRMFRILIPKESASFFSSSVTGPSILTILFNFSHCLMLSNRNRSLLPLHMIVSMSATNTRMNASKCSYCTLDCLIQIFLVLHKSYHGLWYKYILRLRVYRKLAQKSWNASDRQDRPDPTENKNESKVALCCVKSRPNDRNISTQHVAIFLGATCCVCLATLVRRVEQLRIVEYCRKIELVRMPGDNIVARTWPNDHNIVQHPQVLHEKFDHFQISHLN